MINHPLKSGTPDITGTLVVTGASGLTGVYQELRPPAGGLCYMCAGAPAPAGGQKTASVATLIAALSECCTMSPPKRRRAQHVADFDMT